MPTFKDLTKSLEELLDENASPELADKVSKTLVIAKNLEDEELKLANSREELRQKYVEAVKNNSFRDDKASETTESTPKSLEECLLEASKAK